MLESDFIDHNIVDFTPKEITSTGANLEDVKLETMVRIQKYRSLIGRRVSIFKNGLTTGNHKSPYHPLGLAIDTGLYIEDGPVKPLIIFKSALEAGFKAIGIYWNGVAFSCHFDLRPKYAFWCGVKDGRGSKSNWVYHGLIVDPSQIPTK